MIRKIGRAVFLFWFTSRLSLFETVVMLLAAQAILSDHWWVALFYLVTGFFVSVFFGAKAVKMMGNPQAEAMKSLAREAAAKCDVLEEQNKTLELSLRILGRMQRVTEEKLDAIEARAVPK